MCNSTVQGIISHATVSTKLETECYETLLIMYVCRRQLYWSDCSQPTTIQTASATDGSDRRVLINDTQHSCITALAIDVNSQLPLATNRFHLALH